VYNLGYLPFNILAWKQYVSLSMVV